MSDRAAESDDPSLQGVQRVVREVIAVSSPKAGSGAGREQLPRLIDQLATAKIDTLTTTSIDEMKERIATARSTGILPTVVAAGGDGTLALVADNVQSDVPLVPMPFGTENLLARYFGHTSSADQMFATITQGRSFPLDAGRANGKLFLVMASCGFDAEVVRGLHLRRKGHINRFSYAKPIFRALRRYSFGELNVAIKDVGAERDIIARWAMVFNLPRYGGGLSIEPGAIGNDGLLDVITFKKGTIASGLKYAAGVATQRHLRSKEVTRCRASAIEIRSPNRVPYQLDGDYAGRLPLRIETLPGRVHLLLPKLATS